MSLHYWITAGILTAFLAGTGCAGTAPSDEQDASVKAAFDEAAERGRLAAEGFRRSHRYMQAWLEQSDPATGLIPRNLDESRDIWNAADAAADNYPFMVLTASFTDRALFEGRMRDMLRREATLASREGLPDTYSFSKGAFRDDEPDEGSLIFGASEYIKDGLLPLTEWLGPSPWSERLIQILDAVWERANVQTPRGPIVSRSHEINGEMLQILSRMYWMTGNEQYLTYAVRLGDYYLLGGHHPTRDTARLRLRDHGGEIVAGLSELYATVHHARPEKQSAYREPLHEMLDRVLEVGRNEHGLFYNVIDPQRGTVVDSSLADTYGYIYNAYYTVYLIDSTEAYRQAVQEALASLYPNYEHHDWERGSADGDADAIESALNLYNRERVSPAADWLDREIQFMWNKQDSSHRAGTQQWKGTGIIEGWHGDGNFARTSLMYSLWKTQGLHVQPWRGDLRLGAVEQDGRLYVSLSADSAWSGRLLFDQPRHRTHLGLPLDWPRINQFPEWFTVEAGQSYRVTHRREDRQTAYSAALLTAGMPLVFDAGTTEQFIIEPIQ